MKYGKFRQTHGITYPGKPEPSADKEETMKVDEASKDVEIVVMYFGAGRGPLIRRALAAAKKTKANVKVIALDKNPNAIVTLRNMIIDENLQDRVSLVAGDMRHVSVDAMKGDILMSELLGSFGDNELSPECLNPTEKYLRPGGIYLPWSYTNNVLPLSSQYLWNEVTVYAHQGISGRVQL